MPHERNPAAPRWLGPTFLVCAAVLVPWAALLFLTRPDDYSANHWWLAWGGFDVGLELSLAVTAVAAIRRSALTGITAAVSGTLLICDAWFDVVTSRGAADIVWAVAGALVELPLAGVCFWIAHRLARQAQLAGQR